jgi:hypothetical protein
MEEKKEPESFEVKDKRRFVVDAGGEAKGEESASESGRQQGAASPPGDRKPAAEPKSEKKKESTSALPEIDFATFILSLSSSALLHLGLVENPVTQKTERNLPLAKQTIDIIVMLRDKTKGNVSTDEANLMENLIADLRMKYVNELNR